VKKKNRSRTRGREVRCCRAGCSCRVTSARKADWSYVTDPLVDCENDVGTESVTPSSRSMYVVMCRQSNSSSVSIVSAHKVSLNGKLRTVCGSYWSLILPQRRYALEGATMVPRRVTHAVAEHTAEITPDVWSMLGRQRRRALRTNSSG
jgi:hypothetical protein